MRSGRCAEHQRKVDRAYDEQRGTAAQRGYGVKWKAAREKFLREHGTCVLCGKPVKLKAARGDPELGVVDHKVPHRGDMGLFWSRSNWQTMHKGCHDGPKQSLERTGYLRGCDESGVPLDAGHHWSGEG